MTTATPARRPADLPIFVTGSVLRHILVMTGAGALGLMAIFAGDLANIYFLSRSGDEAVVAAVGYAAQSCFSRPRSALAFRLPRRRLSRLQSGLVSRRAPGGFPPMPTC